MNFKRYLSGAALVVLLLLTTRAGATSSYQYKPGEYVVDCGEDEVYTLTFDSPTHAKGKVTEDVRVYSLTFEK